MKKADKRTLYIVTSILAVIAIINMLKANSLISSAINNPDNFTESALKMSIFMYLIILLSVLFIGLLGYKFFYLKEKDHVYAAAMICGCLLFLTACNGALFFGGIAKAADMDGAQAASMIKSFLNYMGVAKLSGLTFFGTAAWTLYRLVSSTVSVPKETLLLPKTTVTEEKE